MTFCYEICMVVTSSASFHPILSLFSSAAIVDLDGRIYIRNWQGGILSGGFEKNPKPIFTEGRNQLEIQNLHEDWDHFGMLGSKGLQTLHGRASTTTQQKT